MASINVYRMYHYSSDVVAISKWDFTGPPNIPGIYPFHLLLHTPSHLRRRSLRTCDMVFF